MSLIIALIGCSKTKKQTCPGEFIAAQELYTGDLFRLRVAHVEKRGIHWMVLSGRAGVVSPGNLVQSYDETLIDKCELDRASWHLESANQLIEHLYYEFGKPKLSRVTVELHASERYCEPLGSILGLLGVDVVRPVKGLGIGEQRYYYLNCNGGRIEPSPEAAQ